jgi:hypothetical protein
MPNGVLSVVTGGQAKFVQHHLFRLSICLLIPQPQQQQAFSGYISNGATWLAPVTFSDGLTRGGPFSTPSLQGDQMGLISFPHRHEFQAHATPGIYTPHTASQTGKVLARLAVTYAY